MTERAFLGGLPQRQPPPDRTLGQAAYEKWAAVFADARPKAPWDRLRPPVRARWETIAVAVVEQCGGSDG